MQVAQKLWPIIEYDIEHIPRRFSLNLTNFAGPKLKRRRSWNPQEFATTHVPYIRLIIAIRLSSLLDIYFVFLLPHLFTFAKVII